MIRSAAPRLGPGPLAAALDALPDGVALFDSDWTIRYVNPAAAALWHRDVDELVDRSIWVALPELGGTILHSFLLHARGAGAPVTWRGFYPPAGRWLSATAVVVDGLLQLHFRPDEPARPEPAAGRRDVAGKAGVAARPMTPDDGDRDRLRFLAEVSEALIATLDTGESAHALAELVVSRLCDWAIVSVLAEDGRPTDEARAHRDPARRGDLDAYLAGRTRDTGETSPLRAALLTGEPMQLRQVDPVIEHRLPDEEVRAAWRRLDPNSATFVPLRARGETFGALTLVNSGHRPPHTEMEIATAVEVARRGALALDNARLYGRQLKIAETLQRSLLSPPIQPDRLEIAVRYQPAASNMHVGGDWYDAFQQPDGATLLVIGDVVGHNVDAAAAMGQIRSLVRGLASDHPDSPAQTLARVDRVLSTLRVDALATALVARIEQSAEQARHGLRTLRWSSAGHLPPLLLRPDGEVRLLETPAERLLGADPTAARSDHEFEVRPGDTVVLFTDGLVEHGRSGIDEGLTRLTGVLAKLPDVPCDELCDQLLARIVTSRADDDIAILAVRFHPETGELDG